VLGTALPALSGEPTHRPHRPSGLPRPCQAGRPTRYHPDHRRRRL